MISIDTETCLIMPGILAPPLVCVTTAERAGGEVTRGLLHRSEDVVTPVSAAFSGETTFANAPYDLAVFLAHDDRLRMPVLEALDRGDVHCVQTRQKLMDLADGRFRFEDDEETGEVKVVRYALSDLGARWKLGGKTHDEWRLRYHELYDVPPSEWPDAAVYYAVRDADLTLRVHEKQDELASGAALANLKDEARHVRAHFALHLASARGLRTDPVAVAELREQTQAVMGAMLPDLVDVGLCRKDGTRDTKEAVRRMISTGYVEPTQVGAALILGDPERLEKLPDTDEARAFIEAPTMENFLALAKSEGRWVSVSKESCFACGDKVLAKYSEYSQARNLLSGSVKDLERGVLLPIQTRFDPIKETGRTGSSKPNIQNLRRKMHFTCPHCGGMSCEECDRGSIALRVRECYVPREGYLFAAADYAAAELHTLAQSCLDLFGASRLADALNGGVDPHCWLGSLLTGSEYDDFLLRYKQGDEEADTARHIAKQANFGFPGGCSARTFVGIAHASGTELDEHSAARLRAVWFRAWPEMEQFFDYVGKSTDSAGWYWARLTRSGRLRSRCTFTAACNTYFQGPAADGGKEALWDVTREIWGDEPSPMDGCYLVNFVHDEILLEAPVATAALAADRLGEVMATAFNRIVPDCPTTAEAFLMTRWSKKAKPVRGPDGLLVPWTEAA